MRRLTNISDDPWTLDKFHGDKAEVTAFLDRHGLDGLELIRWGGAEAAIPTDRVIGKHLSFWPTWLDFWRRDGGELLRQFGSDEAIGQYYRAATVEEFISHYRAELADAEAIGAQYVVFHVSHVQLEHSFDYRFTYSDEEVVVAFIELLNTIMDGRSYPFRILMENHWFPGLTFLDGPLARRLLDGVHADKKGFVLDIGHIMNTNTGLASEEQAVEYILDALGRLDGTVRKAIVAIHLNSSLTGQYVINAVKNVPPAPPGGYRERLLQAMGHVSRIDRHEPFLHPSIRRVIDLIQPEFLVYELAYDALPALDQAVRAQNEAVGVPAP